MEVPLGGKASGLFTLIDDEDAWIAQHGWSLDGRGYVQARIAQRTVTLHRLILGFPRGVVDHKNHDRLDNTRKNLWVTDHRGNARNQSKRRGTTSRLMGVYRHTQTGRWVATGKLDGKSVYLGCYASEEQAAAMSRRWRISTYGYDRVAGDVKIEGEL